MFRKLLLSLIFCLAIVPVVFAQTGTLTGVINDSRTGEELPGVNVFVQGPNLGAATNVEGEYSITNIPYGTYTVRVTYVGYSPITQTVDINALSQTRNFTLTEDFVGLEEMIVTGQGSGVERRRLSTNVTTISARQMDRLPQVQLDQILQANISNAQIRMSSGQPGTASLIRGRGINSALTATTPVIYIDGVRVDNTTGQALGFDTGGAQSSSIADIPVENIERIEVVSGGAATTQFGSDAANGVIQIFTKQGVEGTSQFSFESSVGATVGTRDFLRFQETGDILFEPGLVQEYRLGGSGGTRDFSYSFSGSMRGDDGFRLRNNQARHNLRGTVSAAVNPAVRYTGSVGFASSEFRRDENANSLLSAYAGLEVGDFGDLSELSTEDFQDLKEFTHGYTNLIDITEDVKRFQTSHQLDFNISTGLTANTVVGIDSRSSKQLVVETNEMLIARGWVPEGTVDQGFLGRSHRDFLGLTLEGGMRYERNVGNFSSITNVGGQIFRNDDQQVRLEGSGLPDGSLNINTSEDITASDFRRTVVNYGIYALENFGYMDRYFFELGLRVDQNTAFGDEVGPQVYPKAGFVYNINDEPFFDGLIPGNVVSTLRVRSNIGWAGNFPTPFSNEILALTNPFLGGLALEFGIPGDINLKPERTRTIEAGADISFLADMFNFEITYFQAETTDALFRAPFARSYGLGSALQNLGTIENKGFEFASNMNVYRTRDANVNVRASFNTLSHKVIDNGDSAPFSVGGFGFLGSYVDEGYEVGYFRGNKPIFADDGSLDDVEPNAYLGSPVPDYFGSISLNADYRNFSLTVTSDYQMGAQGVNADEVLRYFAGLQDGRIPEASSGESFFDLAGIWVEDTDYLKVRLVSLNYRVPSAYYAGIVRRISVGFTVTNPFNFSTSVFDPEVTAISIAGLSGENPSPQGGVGVGGFAFGTESAPRHFLGRIRIDF
ncbi:MAG: TonB-dependent receptor [Balneolales bacterium]